eukprot:709052-Hanusia_phi.AAC.3
MGYAPLSVVVSTDLIPSLTQQHRGVSGTSTRKLNAWAVLVYHSDCTLISYQIKQPTSANVLDPCLFSIHGHFCARKQVVRTSRWRQQISAPPQATR